MIFVTHDELRRILDERLEDMSTQADADALTAQVAQIATDLTTTTVTLQAEIDALAGTAGAPAVDLTGLQAAVVPLDAAVKAVGALTPTPTPPAPTAIFGTPPAGS